MAQKNKCTITEERLARLVSESIEEVLLEAKNDEALGTFLGGLAGKVRNGVNKFRDDFNASRNAQLYKNRNYDSYTSNGLDQNARNFDKTMSQNYRYNLQKGASSSAPGSFTTPYGDNVGGKIGSDERAKQNTLQQIQKMFAELTKQMQTLNGLQGDTGDAQGSTGGAQGSTEGAQGSTGGAQGSTGGAQGKQSLDQDAIRKAHGKAAGQNRVITPKPAPTPESPEQKAAADKVDQTGDMNSAFLGEGRKAQITGTALQKIISEAIKRRLNESWKSSLVRG